MRTVVLMMAAAGLAACASGQRPTAMPHIAAAVDSDQLLAASATASEEYRIGPSDKLMIRVFQVPDISFDEIWVDAGGFLQLPLIGSVKASGFTAEQLASDIEGRLAERYIRDPQVQLSVTEAASQKVTIDGAVTKPGVYEMRGRTTLLQAVAMAEGPSRLANLRSVAVFRTVDSRPMVAVFDMGAIRNGQMADPVILGDDVVVVDTSRLSARMQDALQVLPALASFFYFAQN